MNAGSAQVSNTETVEICRVDELEGGMVKPVRVGRLAAGAVLRDDEVFVFQAGCPHRAGPLDKGHVRGTLTAGEPGEMLLDEERLVISCPWHNYEYCLRTGTTDWDKSLRIRVFQAEIVDGRVMVTLPGQTSSAATTEEVST
jgi:nitrite reductase/ring-hydroxylating ferredoxin subunit